MNTTFSLPTPEAVANLLTILLGKDTKVTSTGHARIENDSPIAAGVYITQAGEINALCVFDAALASYAGAALTMIPASVATENVRDGVFADGISENLYEVFNVCVGFFNHGNVPHIRFSEMYVTPPALPEGIDSFADDQALLTAGMEITIEGYGSGQLSLFAV